MNLTLIRLTNRLDFDLTSRLKTQNSAVATLKFTHRNFLSTLGRRSQILYLIESIVTSMRWNV